MQIYVDADACPVKSIIEQVAREHSIPVTMVIDTSHQLKSDYSEIMQVSQGKDSVDLVLINHAKKGDIVVTQDYGVASLALGKGCKAIHQSGMIYTNDNIDMLLMERHVSAKSRRTSKHHQGKIKKRTPEDDARFEEQFRLLIKSC
jgi:uncharacterized protein YaiI (UPF0178 family)